MLIFAYRAADALTWTGKIKILRFGGSDPEQIEGSPYFE
jgi:hypothetical protein